MNGKDRTVTISGALIFMVVMAGAFISGAPMPQEITDEMLELLGLEPMRDDIRGPSEYGAENSENPHIIKVPYDRMLSVSFTLTWADEPGQSSRFTNQPDSMTLEVESPEGVRASEGPGDAGSLTVTFDFGKPRDFEMNEWLVTVKVGECGDQEPLLNILGLRTVADDGNTYSLSGEVVYYPDPDAAGSGISGKRGAHLPALDGVPGMTPMAGVRP